MGKPFRILSIDGGGLRGIIPVKVLQHIEAITGKRIVDMFDLIAGTSTGGLIACGMTIAHKESGELKYSLKDIENVYVKNGEKIFKERNILNKFIHRWIIGLIKPEFKAKGLDDVLKKMFCDEIGEDLIAHCIRPIFITAYDLHNNQPLIFSSRHAFKSSGENLKLFDVCRATSAGPTYLPAHRFIYDGKMVTCIDGGVFINNPSMAALVEIWKYRDDSFYNAKELKDEDIFVLSISTGHCPLPVISERKARRFGGKISWIKPITNVMMAGQSQEAEYQAMESLRFAESNNFLRININIDTQEHADMTDSSEQTREYLISQVKNQFLNNTPALTKLNDFLEKSGIIE